MRLLVILVLAMLALFIAMYLVADAGGIMDDATVTTWMRSLGDRNGTLITALAVVALLAIDLLLPVPSSVVMTLSGYLLGTALGTAASFAGAMVSALVGFGLCRRFGRRGFLTRIGETDAERVDMLFALFGDWTVLLSRPLPMLTEVVSCVSGLSSMSGRRFTLLAGAGTLPLCALYAWAGQGVRGGAPAWMLLAAVAVPALGLVALRLLAPRRRTVETSCR